MDTPVIFNKLNIIAPNIPPSVAPEKIIKIMKKITNSVLGFILC